MVYFDAEDFSNAYRNWMINLVNGRDYGILLDVMQDTPFRWSRAIPRDEDRADDGRYFRQKFMEDLGVEFDPSVLEEPCSFLEFLLALSYSIDDQFMYDPEHPEQPIQWFWLMMRNLGLADLTDVQIMRARLDAYEIINDAMDTVMDRKYGYNGYPGLFPLRKPEMDQRRVEIWYQANAYFMEKYFE